MTASAVAFGVEHGATAATLESTEMGFPVYRANGFETVFDYRMFSA